MGFHLAFTDHATNQGVVDAVSCGSRVCGEKVSNYLTGQFLERGNVRVAWNEDLCNSPLAGAALSKT